MKPTSQPSEARGVVLMLISIVFFALNIFVVRALALAYPGGNGWQATLFRGIAGVIFVSVFYGFGRGLQWKPLFKSSLMIWRGILGAAGIVLFYITMIELGAARAVVINLTYPIFGALMASFFLNERLSPVRLFWIIVGFIGLSIFMSDRISREGINLYDLLALIGAFISAVVIVLIRRIHRTEHGSTIYASQCFYCLILALPFTAPHTGEIPPMGILGLFLAGLIATGGQLTMTFAYRHLDVSKGSSLQMLLPIVTAVGAWGLFGETLGFVEIFGASLTLSATYMVNRQTSKTSPTVASPQATNS
ncbi:DMT family transporter [Akkermansiaceae bacterium]|nr:DMT family transporter [Akkermansiaceae bacterium]MDB4537605.1 DMT family transporter [Akkermansiaceae bacterium]